MSTRADPEVMGSSVPEVAQHSVSRYDCITQLVHWTTLFLLIATFATIWLIRYADTREQADQLVQLHRSLGLTVLCTTSFRLMSIGAEAVPAGRAGNHPRLATPAKRQLSCPPASQKNQ